MTNFRDNVKRLCALQGITQKQVAAKIGITDSSLNITLGRNDPKFSSLKRIADALGVSVDVLTSDNLEQSLANEQRLNSLEHQSPTPQQGLFCPHCGKPLTLFIKAENAAEEQ